MTDGFSRKPVPEAAGLDKCVPLEQGELVKRSIAAGSLVTANEITLNS